MPKFPRRSSERGLCGEHWHVPLRIFLYAFFPAYFLLLPDGTLVTVTTYGHWTEGEEAYVVSVRFTLEELDKILEMMRTE